MKFVKKLKILRSTAFAAVLCLACGIIGSTGYGSVAYAVTTEELEQKIKDNEAKIAELDKKISETEGEIEDSEVLQGYYFEKLTAQQEQINLLNNKLYAKEEEIALKEADIERVEKNIKETEQQIEDKTVEIEKLDAQNRENIYKFGQIIRTMYINDSEDVMSVIAGSSDFYDIFVRTEVMKSVGDQNMKFMNDLLDDIHQLEEEQLQLEKDKIQLQEDKEQLERDKEQLKDEWTELDEEKNYTSQLITSYTNEYNTCTDKIANYVYLKAVYAEEKRVSLAEIEAYEREIDELIRQAQLAASGTVVYDDGEWLWPLDSRFTLITTYFGYDEWRQGNHGAIDVGNSGINGANIYAMKSGEVIIAKTTYRQGYDYGMYVVIDHGDGYQSLYAHMSSVYVTVGQMVSQGDVIGLVGSTGWSTGPHLHFEIRKDGTRVDPLQYVNVPQ